MEFDLEALVQAAATPNDGETYQQAAERVLAEKGLTRDQVTDMQDEAVEKFRTLHGEKPTGGEKLDTLEVLAQVVSATRTEQNRIDAVDAEAQEKLDALAAQVEGAAPAEGEGGDEGEGGEQAPAEGGEGGEGEPAPTEATPEGGEPAPTEVVETAPAGEPALVAGAARRPVRTVSISSINRTPVTMPGTEVEAAGEQAQGMAIVAGAGIEGFRDGQKITNLSDLARAAASRITAMPRGRMRDTHLQMNIATMRASYPDDLKALDPTADHSELIERAADRSRLKRDEQGLVAAGGWCSPSDTDYSLVADLSSDNAGLIDVPDVAIGHGGIKTPATPDYSQVFAAGSANIGVYRTEAQENPADLDDYVEKPFYRIPCTTWTESRAGVIFTGVEAGILQNHAYPRLGERHVELAVNIHRHKLNAATIAQMDAGSTPWDGTKFGPSASVGLLNGVGFLSKHLQYKYRSDPNFLLEWVFPEWVKEVMRADYALRSGIPLEVVTDAQLDQWFAQRNARVQWVYDYQDAYVAGDGSGFGGANVPTNYPTTVQGLAYPAGTWVRGRSEIVSLDAVYDTVSTKRNDFLRMFMEEGLLVHKRAYTSYRASFAIPVTGTTSALSKLDHGGKVAAA